MNDYKSIKEAYSYKTTITERFKPSNKFSVLEWICILSTTTKRALFSGQVKNETGSISKKNGVNYYTVTGKLIGKTSIRSNKDILNEIIKKTQVQPTKLNDRIFFAKQSYENNDTFTFVVPEHMLEKCTKQY